MWKLKVGADTVPSDPSNAERWLSTLNNHVGRQVWHFHPELDSPEDLQQIQQARQHFYDHRFEKKHSSDILMRMQFAKENSSFVNLPQIKVKDKEDVVEEAVTQTLRRAMNFYSTIQADDGHWPGDYGGPMFLLPGLVITLSITGALNAVLSTEHQREICRYLYNHQNRDGGWGLHIEGPSTMFGSVLNYVTLRLLGEEAEDGQGGVDNARKWILDHGGATAITSWGKMWLSVLGVYEWAGNNPLPPELWLLPYLLPCHPGRMWCHCRMVFNTIRMEFLGYNGSQLWDTAFAVQAIMSTKLVEEYGTTIRKAHKYMKDSQAVLLLSKLPSEIVGKSVDEERLYDAVNVILSLQNTDGGFATYELTRSYRWLELMNPAETFGDIVIDYPYVECTSAAIQALAAFRKLYPGHRSNEISNCIAKAADFIESIQATDGSWYGSWGVCFTYGGWFGIKGLVAAGRRYENSSSLRKACDFLLSKELPAGGWGESYLSCQDKVYTNIKDDRSHLVNTAWAMLSLIDAGQDIMGVFNKNCMISYSAYRNIFPIWALGAYRCRVLQAS
uniref:Terpene cyclase/mutase family member n=1 Tax=Cucumis sativus TaxID=3659 RepID=A0A0A0KAJ1_CUCSA|nr:cycloartenol synthase [Cucumis sativus]